jgi:F-type H+-transporting ATPase subunit a
MGEEQISPDAEILWDGGFVNINLTLVTTWVVMALLIGGSWAITRRLRTGPGMSRWQNALEVVVTFLRDQIADVSGQDPRRYLPFVGTLFVFILTSNVLIVVPGYVPPTASLSTTAALALCVFFAVPAFGIAQRGVGAYLGDYLQPNALMLPFNILSELSRTLALAVRLFGNVMSFTKIVAILLAVAPLVFPALLNALGLLTGVIQAYIFTVLAIVYISAGSSSRRRIDDEDSSRTTDDDAPRVGEPDARPPA